MYKNPELKTEYEKQKYIKYQSNAKFKSWLTEQFYYCNYCTQFMHYMSKYRHLKTKKHQKNYQKNKHIKRF